MLIINADDYGRSCSATDRILACCRQGTITCASGMVFMEDSERAAGLANECGLDVGLHLNLTTPFTQKAVPPPLAESHKRIVTFLNRSNYSMLLYHPRLQGDFRSVFEAQLAEFTRLYGKPPSHFDGHHHMHLCTNMLAGKLMPAGEKVRRNFTYYRGEKSLIQRMYRAVSDRWLKRAYPTTDYLFSLSECLKHRRLARVFELARSSSVELQTHPENKGEFDWLMGDVCAKTLNGISKGTYAQLGGPCSQTAAISVLPVLCALLWQISA